MGLVKIEGKVFRGNTLVEIGLASKLFGLGKNNARRILASLGLFPFIRFRELSEAHIIAIQKELQSYVIETEAKSIINRNIQVKRAIGSYVGKRHVLGYPVRGQRTKNNAQTAKRMNRIPRRFYSTATSTTFGQPTSILRNTVNHIQRVIPKLRFW
ncbi:hypothetical protein V1514DRAFT_335474 [Lipomyces japonicus]|uniref:mitochondrial 37S ribosomal protein uS13m n=1 Tax=Lipomyces japonicus TaxID=56871 RepID=UPI0034CF3055